MWTLRSCKWILLLSFSLALCTILGGGGEEAITATSMVIVIAQRVGLCIYMNITLKLYHVSNHDSLDIKLQVMMAARF